MAEDTTQRSDDPFREKEICTEISPDPGHIRNVEAEKEALQANTGRKILEIGIDGRYTWYNMTGHPTIVDDEIKAYILEERAITPNLQPLPKEDKLFTCPECGKSFARVLDRIIHRRIHTGQKPFTCAKCRKTFNFKCELERHEKTHTNPSNPFTCSECGVRCYTSLILARHKKVHTAETVYKCSHCGKLFINKYDRNKHEKSHKVLKKGLS